MPKQTDETLQQYRDRVLDSKSKSFCGAKWYNATTWLGSGTTASCHHPPAHKIPIIEIQEDFTAIHNTKHKKEMRRQMQTGERPAECEYCWKMEDMKKDAVSDRTFKSIIYSDEELQAAYNADWNESVNLKTFEIAFDRTCNLACSYCNASFSTTWAKDINKNGPYINLVSDGAGAFKQNGDWTQPYKNDDDNPYIQAFWKWWDNGLSESLEELRITGGEPLMSGNTWKLFDWFESQDSNMRFAINSNLIAKKDIVDKLIAKTQNIKHFELYTSCEAIGAQAEYIRDGLDYEMWLTNIKRMLTESNHKGIHIMMTINSLCLFSITDFLDEVYKLKELTQSRTPTVSLNLLRFPSFQSPLALPNHIKDYCHNNLNTWWQANKHKEGWHEFERASIERLIDYLVTVDAPHRRTSNPVTLWRDFKTFYAQYDKRRGKSLDVFPAILTNWVASIPDTDASILELAEQEGWILKPDNKNIDEPLAAYDK
jgi:organic radical activating enzyme|tara:strand:- start:6866 stop:8317 length:1452 start_codon:yes stop_codon:yes gene_type:complete